MTSAAGAAPPTSQHQQPPNQRHQPQQAPEPVPASSPPTRRDLKSWWKGFAKKHPETTQGRSALPVSPRRSTSPFAELSNSEIGVDVDHTASQLSFSQVHQNVPNISTTQNLRQASVRAESSTQDQAHEQHQEDKSFSVLTCLFRALRLQFHSYRKLLSESDLTVAEPNKPQGIFGVPLRQSINYANVAISLVDEDGKSYIYGYVPIVVAKCGVFLKEKATGVEGIFRLSGSEKRIKELKHAFNSPDRYGKGLVWDGYTVHDAANVLRRYLNDLPEPVVPLDLYEKFREPLRGATKQTAGDVDGPQFVENFDMNAAISRYQQLITELPPLNRQLLLYILDLLAVFAAKSDENRMNSQNLAAIFQPGLLSHPKHDMAPEEYRLSQAVIIFLIENQDHFLIGMQGTGADEKTVREIQSAGSAPARGPVTPIPNRRSSMKRTLSNSSVGAESVAKEGTIRRNKSTSSRHSRTSNGAHSPASPALGSTTPTGGGLARSNTVPSKKSPGLRSGRFANRHDPSHSPLTPLTPVTPSAVAAAREPPPAVVEEVPTPPEQTRAVQTSGQQRTQQTLAIGTPSTVRTGRSQERLLEPRAAENMTPSRERQIHNLFTRSSPGDTDKPPRNKLRKKKLPDSSNPSAQSSTTSLPRSGNASPAIEVSNPLDSYPLTTSPLATVPQEAGELGSQLQPTDTPSEPTPRVSQVPSSNTLHPDSAAEHTLKTKTSPPTSLHSSFNETSDLDRHDGLQGPLSTESLGTEPNEREVERKRRWRLSRRKEDIPPGSNPSSPQKRMGANFNADMSTSSVASSSALEKPRKSFTGESHPTAVSQDQPWNTDSGSREGRDETNRGLTGWIKNKYRDAKDHVDNRRNKSPPADRFNTLGETILPSRGKSMDVPRPTEESVAGQGQTEANTVQ